MSSFLKFEFFKNTYGAVASFQTFVQFQVLTFKTLIYLFYVYNYINIAML